MSQNRNVENLPSAEKKAAQFVLRVQATIISIFVLIVCCVGGCVYHFYSEGEKRDKIQMVYIIAELAIKEKLKAPASADFPLYPTKMSVKADGTYIVMSYVDAQNSFGAIIRSYWLCQLKFNGYGNWDNPNDWAIVEATLME